MDEQLYTIKVPYQYRLEKERVKRMVNNGKEFAHAIVDKTDIVTVVKRQQELKEMFGRYEHNPTRLDEMAKYHSEEVNIINEYINMNRLEYYWYNICNFHRTDKLLLVLGAYLDPNVQNIRLTGQKQIR